MKLRVTIVTLFPELFSALEVGLLGKAMERGQLEVDFVNPRDFTTDKHRTVDDAPYGGGSGMVLMPGPYVDALEKADPDRPAKMMEVMMGPSSLTRAIATSDATKIFAPNWRNCSEAMKAMIIPSRMLISPTIGRPSIPAFFI